MAVMRMRTSMSMMAGMTRPEMIIPVTWRLNDTTMIVTCTISAYFIRAVSSLFFF